jgi:hypothetical protein
MSDGGVAWLDSTTHHVTVITSSVDSLSEAAVRPIRAMCSGGVDEFAFGVLVAPSLCAVSLEGIVRKVPRNHLPPSN